MGWLHRTADPLPTVPGFYGLLPELGNGSKLQAALAACGNGEAQSAFVVICSRPTGPPVDSEQSYLRWLRTTTALSYGYLPEALSQRVQDEPLGVWIRSH